MNLSNFLIGAGKRYRSYEIIEEFQQYAKIEKIHIPPNYQARPVRNNIAVILLDHHLKYSSHIMPICIDWENYLFQYTKNGIKGRVAGWGATSVSQPASEKLLTTNLTTVTNDDCKKLVDPNYLSEIVGDRFCARGYDNATACGGDSGGGFAIQYKIGSTYHYFLAGVISVGLNVENYCSDGFLTAFTNIQYYQDLIKSVISEARNPFSGHTLFG